MNGRVRLAEECSIGDGKQDDRDQLYDHDLDESATGMGTETVPLG
jgi:hypothetical protein